MKEGEEPAFSMGIPGLSYNLGRENGKKKVGNTLDYTINRRDEQKKRIVIILY